MLVIKILTVVLRVKTNKKTITIIKEPCNERKFNYHRKSQIEKSVPQREKKSQPDKSYKHQ